MKEREIERGDRGKSRRVKVTSLPFTRFPTSFICSAPGTCPSRLILQVCSFFLFCEHKKENTS